MSRYADNLRSNMTSFLVTLGRGRRCTELECCIWSEACPDLEMLTSPQENASVITCNQTHRTPGTTNVAVPGSFKRVKSTIASLPANIVVKLRV